MIAIVQPFIPDYREEFFMGLKSELQVEIFTFEKGSRVKSRGFRQSTIKTKHLSYFTIGQVFIYNFFPLLSRRFDKLVLMGSVKHLSTWIILLFNLVLKRDIILWGHGISIKKYHEESIKQPWLRRLFYKMANHAWFYTSKELEIWNKEKFGLKGIGLNNTISQVDKIIKLDLPNSEVKKSLKLKHNIKTPINLIICVRFSNPNRKAELLLDLIDILDGYQYGLIIIGDGPLKPNFEGIKNVYDYNAIYDFSTKQELFSIADFYIQPAWTGLSIVEALAHGLPVCTLERSKNIHQCVEFGYLEDGLNAIIAKNIEELANKIVEIDSVRYLKMRKNISPN